MIEEDDINVTVEKLFVMVQKMGVECKDQSAIRDVQSVAVLIGSRACYAENGLPFCSLTEPLRK